MNAKMFAFSAAAFAVTAAVIVFALVSQPDDEFWTGEEAYLETQQGDRPLGVDVLLTAGGETVRATWPALDFEVSSAAELDPQLPDGPFEGVFTCRFRRQDVLQAALGADLRGGQLIIRHDDEIVLTEFADSDEAMRVQTRLPVDLAASYQQIVYEFTAKGDGPYRLQALWLPVGDAAFRPLPGAGGS
jgi:hypothetical protein